MVRRFFILLVVFLLGCVSAGGQDYGEPQGLISREEAYAIAEASPCMDDGALKDSFVYNEVTTTWWIDLEPAEAKEFCTNPACVVSEETMAAETNWRCTGLLPGLLPE
ncbi:MAG: hypothetical protein ABH829_02750 [archaeon]